MGNVRVKVPINRGTVKSISIPCKCGGNAKIQEWIEQNDFRDATYCCQIFCEYGDSETEIFSAVSAKEARESAIKEWSKTQA